MTIDIFEGQDFQRKTFYIQRVVITPGNMDQLAEIVGGEVKHDGDKEQHFSRDYILVPVRNPMNRRQTTGYIGDVIVKQGSTYKVYPESKFRQMFEPKAGSNPTPEPKRSFQGKKSKGKGPNPGQMPKKRPSGTPAPTPEPITEADTLTPISKTPVEVVPDLIKEGGVVRRLTAEERQTLPEEGIDLTRNTEVVTVTHNEFGPAEMEATPEEKQELIDNGTLKPEVAPESETEFQEQKEAAVATEDLRGLEIEEPEVKPITLDQLNSQPGDPRTAAEIYAEGGQTPGMKFRGEA